MGSALNTMMNSGVEKGVHHPNLSMVYVPHNVHMGTGEVVECYSYGEAALPGASASKVPDDKFEESKKPVVSNARSGSFMMSVESERFKLVSVGTAECV